MYEALLRERMDEAHMADFDESLALSDEPMSMQEKAELMARWGGDIG